MEKICNSAQVISITIPDTLADFNEENDAHRARISFVYLGTASGEFSGVDNDAQALLASCRTSALYSCIIDLSSVKGDSDEDRANFLFEQLKGKSVLMTTFVMAVSDINPDETQANNGERTYSSFSDSYVGKYDEDETAYQRIKDRINRQIDSGNLSWGEYTPEKQPSRNNRH